MKAGQHRIGQSGHSVVRKEMRWVRKRITTRPASAAARRPRTQYVKPSDFTGSCRCPLFLRLFAQESALGSRFAPPRASLTETIPGKEAEQALSLFAVGQKRMSSVRRGVSRAN